MNAMELFRTAYNLGINKKVEAKTRIEELYSKYEKYREGAIEEGRLKGHLYKAQEALDETRLKVAGEIEKLEALKEFKADNIEKLFNRFKYAGKLKGKNEAEQTILFNEWEQKFKVYREIETFLNNAAIEQIKNAENDFLQAKKAFKAFENKELPTCYDRTWQEIFENIVRLEELESE